MKIMHNKIIVILAMHRSGSSLISAGLQVFGVELGDKLLSAGVENMKGYWEDTDILNLNIEMLHAIKSDWFNLTPIDAIDLEILQAQGYLLRAAELLKQKVSNTSIFGFKEPRTTKLLPFWKMVFSYCQFDVSYIIAMRNPLSVARSLEKRDGFEATQSYLLWLSYVLTSLTDSGNCKRVLVDYDCFIQSPVHELNRIAKTIDLQIDPAELQRYKNEFLDESLRHTVYDLNDLLLDDNCLPIVFEIYADLLNVVLENTKTNEAELHDKIIRWSEEFKRLEPILLELDKLYAKDKMLNATLEKTKSELEFYLNKSFLPDDFDSQVYLQIHDDVRNAGRDAVEHYITYGFYEGRPYK